MTQPLCKCMAFFHRSRPSPPELLGDQVVRLTRKAQIVQSSSRTSFFTIRHKKKHHLQRPGWTGLVFGSTVETSLLRTVSIKHTQTVSVGSSEAKKKKAVKLQDECGWDLSSFSLRCSEAHTLLKMSWSFCSGESARLCCR